MGAGPGGTRGDWPNWPKDLSPGFLGQEPSVQPNQHLSYQVGVLQRALSLPLTCPPGGQRSYPDMPPGAQSVSGTEQVLSKVLLTDEISQQDFLAAP